MTAPRALTKETYAQSRSSVELHDHAVCVYESHDELVAPLARFLEEGLERGALNVFVHSFPTPEDAWAFIERARPDARKLASDELVVVSLYRDAFQGESARIDHEHVERVVGSLVERAAKQGRLGTRIFVDASRVYFSESRAKEWFAFESWLGRRLQAEVGLVCAYQRSDALRGDLFPDMLSTHAYRFDASP